MTTSNLVLPRDDEVIHRLKNHLCIIVGFCDLLLTDLPSADPRHRDVMEIYKAAQDAMAMVPDVASRMHS